MKKKLLSILLCLAMTASMLIGCGSNEEEGGQEETASNMDSNGAMVKR